MSKKSVERIPDESSEIFPKGRVIKVAKRLIAKMDEHFEKNHLSIAEQKQSLKQIKLLTKQHFSKGRKARKPYDKDKTEKSPRYEIRIGTAKKEASKAKTDEVPCFGFRQATTKKGYSDDKTEEAPNCKIRKATAKKRHRRQDDDAEEEWKRGRREDSTRLMNDEKDALGGAESSQKHGHKDSSVDHKLSSHSQLQISFSLLSCREDESRSNSGCNGVSGGKSDSDGGTHRLTEAEEEQPGIKGLTQLFQRMHL